MINFLLLLALQDAVDGKKPVDLQKIFTPATDVDEILPGTNRKFYFSKLIFINQFLKNIKLTIRKNKA